MYSSCSWPVKTDLMYELDLWLPLELSTPSKHWEYNSQWCVNSKLGSEVKSWFQTQGKLCKELFINVILIEESLQNIHIHYPFGQINWKDSYVLDSWGFYLIVPFRGSMACFKGWLVQSQCISSLGFDPGVPQYFWGWLFWPSAFLSINYFI